MGHLKGCYLLFNVRRSKCRHLGFSKDNVFVVDTGLHRVFVTNEEDASVFGEPGDKPGQFNNPAEVAFDDHGNSIVVDTRNNRLQLVDSNQNAFPVKVRMTFGYIATIFLVTTPLLYSG